MTAIPLRRIEGKYEILDKLGEGGMGSVYKVRHRLLDEVRVIKVMRPQLLQDEGLKARFLREARTAIQLRHPNVAQLYDFTIDDDGVAFIVMEYIQGTTLESVFRNAGPPPLGLGLEIAQQSLRALGYLHGKGFIHRDISPDNLMLTEGVDGEPLVKLIDLGIAKTLEGGITGYQTQAGTFLGKVRYAPPEQFGAEGATGIDARGDLYSFGIVLYELLTGRYPIRGRDPTSIIAGHLFWPPLDFAESDPEGSIPAGLRETVLKALAKKPEERFPKAQDFSRALAAFRSPSDLAEGGLKDVLSRAASGPARLSVHAPGSTQDRLDLQFGLQTTPSAARLAELTGTPALRRAPLAPAAGTPPDAGIAAVIERVEAKLAHRDFSGAELLLYEGEVDFGAQEVFSSLHERLAEEQRRDREVRTAARRRAEQLSAAVAEIEARLAEGKLDRAGEVLEETAASFGEDTIPLDLRLRLRELRRQAREAELASLLETARKRLGSGDLEGALETAARIERIDPAHVAAGSLREQVAEERRRREEARRKAELAAAVSDVEKRLGRGELDSAEELLALAAAIHGEGEEVLRRLQARLADLRRAALETEVSRLLENARRRLGSADLSKALEELGRVEALAPGRSDATALREEVEAERRRREEEARRRKQLAAAAAAVEKRLGRGDLDGAEELLARAVATHGEEEALRKLRAPLADLRQAALEAQVAGLLENARRRLESGDLAGALEELGPAETLAPGRAEAAHLRERIEAEQRRRAEETRRKAELAVAVSSIEARLDEGKLDRAEELLADAVAAHGETKALRKLRARLADLRRAAVEAQVASLLESVRRRLGSADLAGALEALGRIEELAPARPETGELRERIAAEQRRREEETRREAELAATIAAIDAHLEEGDLEGAADLLPRAAADFGDGTLLRHRRQRIDDLRRRRQEENADSLLAEARRLAASAKLDEALEAVREADRLRPGHMATQTLATEVETERRRHAEAARRETELAAAVRGIDDCFDRGRLEEAARLLPAAVATFGGETVLRERWERLEALRRKAAVPALLAKAESLFRNGEPERAARTLRQVLELDPGNPEAEELMRWIPS